MYYNYKQGADLYVIKKSKYINIYVIIFCKICNKKQEIFKKKINLYNINNIYTNKSKYFNFVNIFILFHYYILTSWKQLTYEHFQN